MSSRQLSSRRLITAACALFALAAGCSDSTGPGGSSPADETYAASLGVNIGAMTKLSNDLYIQDLVAGSGAVASTGHSLTVTYTGWLVNGTQFDSNVGKTPFSLTLGDPRLIAGWNQGLAGMHAGGTRRLVIGSALGYGSDGSPPVIPRNATLVFTVQLISVQ